MKKWVIYALLLLCTHPAKTQTTATDSLLRVISISGNKVTRSQIIERELEIKTGEKLEGIEQKISKSTENLNNTNLFNDVILRLSNDTLYIHVRERWYWWPNIFIISEDPDVNIWLRNPDPQRLTFGGSIENINFRGKRENLQLGFETGFNQSVFLSYSIPKLDKNQKHGLRITAQYSTKKEMFIDSKNNELSYFSMDNKLLEKRIQTSLTHSFRPAFRFSIKSTLIFDKNQLADTILLLNPLFQSSKKNFVGCVISSFILDHRDNKSYALKGYFMQCDFRYQRELTQKPVRMSSFFIKVKGEKLMELCPRWHSAHSLDVGITLNHTNWFYPYYYSNHEVQNARGYELYFLPSKHYLIGRNQLKYVFIQNKKIKMPVIKWEQFNPLPLYSALVFFSDLGQSFKGYKVEENNKTGAYASIGFGIEVATYYNKILRVEYAINKDGKNGVYLQFVNLF